MKFNYTVEAIGSLMVDLKVCRNGKEVFTKTFNMMDLPFLEYMFGNFVATDEERLNTLFKIAHEQGKNYIKVILAQERCNEF